MEHQCNFKKQRIRKHLSLKTFDVDLIQDKKNF